MPTYICIGSNGIADEFEVPKIVIGEATEAEAIYYRIPMHMAFQQSELL
jgi:hypothetical protein